MQPSENLIEAVTCLQAGRLDDAERYCRAGLNDDPSGLDGYQLLAAIKMQQGYPAEAIETLHTALNHHPQNAACRFMLGSALRALGRRDDAMAQYREALERDPTLAEAHSNMGVLYHDKGDLEPAIACYRAALQYAPGHIAARLNLAAALRALGRTEDALREFETIVTFKPDHAYAELMALHSKRELCEWQGYGDMVERVRILAETKGGTFSPILLTSWPVPPTLLLIAAKKYAATFGDPAGFPKRAATSGKIRIGYISADFRRHVVSTVVAPIIEAHDKNRFEVIAYSYGPDDGSVERKHIQDICTDFVDLQALADDEAAQKIYQDRIDVLVDLSGYAGSVRHKILALRPAPVQIFWLGYPSSTGSPAIDYLVADAFTIPAEFEGFYSEKIMRLRGPCQPHNISLSPAQPKARAAYGLPETGFVFCSFNHPQKITPEIFATWMAILVAVPESVLWLRADRDTVHANLQRSAAAVGVDANRLIFAPRLPDAADHLARYLVADVALDTFPHNSHTTANDALWLGCPLITLTGDVFAARLAGSMLQALDVPELITASLSDYRDAAVRLATAPNERAAIKAKLVAARARGLQFDTARFVRQLEACFLEAHGIYTAGQNPRNITAPPS